MAKKLYLGTPDNQVEVLHLQNGNIQTTVKVTGAYPLQLSHQLHEKFIQGNPNVNITLPVAGGEYVTGVGAVGMSIKLTINPISQQSEIELAGSIGGIGVTGKATIDINGNVTNVSGFLGIQLIAGNQKTFLDISTGVSSILRLGVEIDSGGIVLKSNGEASVGFWYGHGEINNSTEVEIIDFDHKCFRAGTLILLADGSEKAVEAIEAGDQILAFEGFGALKPQKVVAVKRNFTNEWIKLSSEKLEKPIFATPNHRFFTTDGQFETLEKLTENASTVNLILANGEKISVFAERIACENEPTYNFEVENFHTYVAGGLRVHNDSVALSMQDLREMGQEVGHQQPFKTITIADKVYGFFESGAQIVIDGATYAVEAISEAYEVAAGAAERFTRDNGRYLTDQIVGPAAQDAFRNTLSELSGKWSNSEKVSSMEILRVFGKHLSVNSVARFVGDSELAKALAYEINGATIKQFGKEFKVQLTDKNGNVSWENLEDAPAPGGYGQALVAGALAFSIQAALNAGDWSDSEYLTQGSLTLASSVAPIFVQDTFFTGDEISPHATGIAAAAMTVVSGLLQNPGMNSREYATLVAQATLSYVTASIGAAISAVAGPIIGTAVAMGIEMIVAPLIPKLIGAGVQMGPGEYGDDATAEAQHLYRFTQVKTVELDKNGNEVEKDTDVIMAIAAHGVTIDKAELLKYIVNDDYKNQREDYLFFNKPTDKNGVRVPLSAFNPNNIIGGSGHDNLIGDGADDKISGGEGSDYIDGRGGHNVIAGDVVDKKVKNETTGKWETVAAKQGNDILIAGSGNDTIIGGGGDDMITAGAGRNMISGGAGHDRISAGNGDDTINAGGGEDIIDAGSGNNIVILGDQQFNSKGKVIGDRDDLQNEVVTGWGNDDITGSAGADIIIADDLSDLPDTATLTHKMRNDTVNAGDGSDLVWGGLGNDIINAGKGNDVIIGGGQSADYKRANTDGSDIDMINGDAGNDIILGDSVSFGTNDLTSGANDGAETLDEDQAGDTKAQDLINGGIGNDYIDGGYGQDTIIGGLGSDVLAGGIGSDKINGDDGVDYIIGGAHNDVINGGKHNDWLYFGNKDGSDIVVAGAGDRLIFTENTIAQLTFKRSGHDLIITTAGGGKVTVDNHFNGQAISRIYDKIGEKVYGVAQNHANGATFRPHDTGAAPENLETLSNRMNEMHADYRDATSPLEVNKSSSWYENNYFTAHDGKIESKFENGWLLRHQDRSRGGLVGSLNAFGEGYNVFKAIRGTADVFGKHTGTLNEEQMKQLEQRKDVRNVTTEGGYTYIDGVKILKKNINDEYNDYIVGGYWAENIRGLDGDDVIYANSGDDTVSGGDGNDFVHGGDGQDTLYGEGAWSGDDEFIAGGYNVPVGYRGGSISIPSETYILKELETSHDLIFGGAGDDEVHGQFGNDTLNGDSGNDVIIGDAGDDWIAGNAGNDTINDTLGKRDY